MLPNVIVFPNALQYRLNIWSEMSFTFIMIKEYKYIGMGKVLSEVNFFVADFTHNLLICKD